MNFADIPIRENTQTITEDWFNSLRLAGVDLEQFGTVQEYDNLASFPVTGETPVIYIAKDTNKLYRWDDPSYALLGGLDNVTNDAQLKRESGDINSFTEKVTPANDDVLLIEDSASSYAKKKIKFSSITSGASGGGATENLLINSDMRINQYKGVTTSSFGVITLDAAADAASNDVYYVDRFATVFSGVTANKQYISTNQPTDFNDTRSFRLTATSTATGALGFYQRVEK